MQVKAGLQVDSKSIFHLRNGGSANYGVHDGVRCILQHSQRLFALAEWLQEHPYYQMDGPDRQIVHRGPWNEQEERNYLTEIQIPLIKR